MLWSQGQSVDSEPTDDEDTAERRGSVANSSASPSRRGSRLFDFLEKKKKNDRKRYKDKEGFVWRRMVHEETEELPSPRAPHLGQWPASPWLNPSEAGGDTTASISTPLPQPPPPPPLAPFLPQTTDQTLRRISMLSNSSEPPLCTQPTGPPASIPPLTTDQTLRKISMLSNSSEPLLCTQPPVQLDSDSLTSFKTCPSDSELQTLIAPRIATDTFKSPVPMPVVVNNATSLIGTQIPSPYSPPQTPIKSTPIPQPTPSSYLQAGVTPAPTMTTPVAAPVQDNMPQALTQQPNAITHRPVPHNQTSENVIGGVRHLVRDTSR